MAAEPKRIIFSNETPNDQGGIIPNDSIDFSRFLKNPVVLKQHNWEEPPLGLMTDVRFEQGGWTGAPIFHGFTTDSKEYGQMYNKGFMRACSIGGEAIWRTTGKTDLEGNPIFATNEQGLRICDKFYLYEVSLVTLPSNPDAIQEDDIKLAAKIYAKDEFQYQSSITKLESQLTELKTHKNYTIMTEEEKAKAAADEAAAKAAEQAEADAKVKEEAEKLKLKQRQKRKQMQQHKLKPTKKQRQKKKPPMQQKQPKQKKQRTPHQKRKAFYQQ